MPIDPVYRKYLDQPDTLRQVLNSPKGSLLDGLERYRPAHTLNPLTDLVIREISRGNFDSSKWDEILAPLLKGKVRTMRRFRTQDAVRFLRRAAPSRLQYYLDILPWCTTVARMTLTAHLLASVAEPCFMYLRHSHILECTDSDLDPRYKSNLLSFKELAALDHDYMPLVELMTIVGYYLEEDHPVDWDTVLWDSFHSSKLMAGVTKFDSGTLSFDEEVESIGKEAFLRRTDLRSSAAWVDQFMFDTAGSSNTKTTLNLSYSGEEEQVRLKLRKNQWNYFLDRHSIAKTMVHNPISPVYKVIKKEEIGKVRPVVLADDQTYLTGRYTLGTIGFSYKYWYPLFVGGDIDSETELIDRLNRSVQSGKIFLPYDSQSHDNQPDDGEISTMCRLIYDLAESVVHDPVHEFYLKGSSGGKITWDLGGQSGSFTRTRGIMSGRMDTTYLGSVYTMVKTRQAKRMIESQPNYEAIRGDDYIAEFDDLLPAVQLRCSLAYVGLVARDSKFRITRHPEFLRKLSTKRGTFGYPTRAMISIYFGKPWSSDGVGIGSWIRPAFDAICTYWRRMAQPFEKLTSDLLFFLSVLSKRNRSIARSTPVSGGVGILPTYSMEMPVINLGLSIRSGIELEWPVRHFRALLDKQGVEYTMDSVVDGVKESAAKTVASESYDKISSEYRRRLRDAQKAGVTFRSLAVTLGNLSFSTLKLIEAVMADFQNYTGYRSVSVLRDLILSRVHLDPYGSKSSNKLELARVFGTKKAVRDAESAILSGYSTSIPKLFRLTIITGDIQVFVPINGFLSGIVKLLCYFDLKTRFQISSSLSTVFRFDNDTWSTHACDVVTKISSILSTFDVVNRLFSW